MALSPPPPVSLRRVRFAHLLRAIRHAPASGGPAAGHEPFGGLRDYVKWSEQRERVEWLPELVVSKPLSTRAVA